MFQIDILTLFPDMCAAAFRESIIARAITKGIIDVRYTQIRDYTTNKQGKVDDYPYGGGPGLVMSYQPIRAAYDAVCSARRSEAHADNTDITDNADNADNTSCIQANKKPHTIYMSPQGKPLTQTVARRLAGEEHIVIICGHYEGIDERIIEDFVDEEISLGDFVLTGGEIPAMALADCVARLIPGVLASEEASLSESHTDILLEYPQYTRPEIIEGMSVPDVLLRGNHKEIDDWRLSQAVERTARKRPDLYKLYEERQRNARIYYFDNSATTAMSQNVADYMADIAARYYANPSSLHNMGMYAEKELTKARDFIAKSISAERSEIYFTSGATEANNWVFRGIVPANKRNGNHVLISAVEHPSVAMAAHSLEALGYEVEEIPVDSRGIVSTDTLKSMIRDTTSLVSVMLVNSETGALQPIAELAQVCKSVRHDIIFHCDCVQGYGKIAVDVRKLGVDMVSVSAHKLHGPRGVGFLYVRKGIRMEPLLFGGGQESGMRSGTENLPAICGMAKAAECLLRDMKANYAKAAEIREIIAGEIRASIKTHIFISDMECSLPYILNVSFPGLRAEVVQHALESRGVYISVGSACSSHKKDRSTVLQAMGNNNNVIDGAIRISSSPFNTTEQAQYVAKMLTQEVRKLYGQSRKSPRNSRSSR